MKRVFDLLLLLIILLVKVSIAFATPSISDTTGILTNGASITILGSSFATNSAPGTSDLQWLGGNIEAGSDGAVFSASGWKNLLDIEKNTVAVPRYTTSQAHSGSKSIEVFFKKTEDLNQYKSFFYYTHPLAMQKVYTTWWVRVNYETSVGNRQWKIHRIQYSSSVDNPTPGFYINNWWDGGKTIVHYPGGGDTGWNGLATGLYLDNNEVPGGPIQEDKWVRMEFYVEDGTAGNADGTFKYWWHDQTNAIDYAVGHPSGHSSADVNYNGNLKVIGSGNSNEIDTALFGQYWGDGGENLNTWWDDVFVQVGTQARVEIGDNATWTNCTHREIQIPSEWKASGDSITITVNQGSFTEGENVYLFVVDADGIPSAGYGPITIGSGGNGADTTPPGDVTDLTIQASDAQIAFSWTNPTDSDFAGTMIRYRTDGTYPTNNGDGIEVCNKTALPGTSDTHTLTGLSNGTTYYFSAFTYDENGNYSKAAHISATPSEADSDITSPGYVTNFAAQTGDSQVVLNWTNPSDSDFAGTMIRYRTDGIYPVDYDDGVEVCNKTANPGYNDTYTLTGLVNDIIYYFSVFTYDETGNYSEAMHISAVPSADIYTKIFGDISGADFPQTCKDTYLNAGEAGVTYSSNSESLNTYTWPTNTAANRIVMKWDLAALPQDVIIQEATLSLYMYGFEKTGGDDNYEITAHKIITHNPDISSCTWNTYDGSNSWTGGANGGEQDIAPAESSTIVDKTSGYKNWNITQMVRDWVGNSSTNLGLMLNSDTTAASDSNRYFRPSENSYQDQRPILTIKYGISDIPKVPSAPSGLGVIVNE